MKRVIFLILALLCALWLGRESFRSRYVFLNGRIYSRSAVVLALPEGVGQDAEVLRYFPNLRWLDLRGTGLTYPQFRQIQAAAENAQILWELEFQGGRLNADTTAVQVRHLTREDARALSHLKKLRRIDGKLCRDYGPLLELAERLPKCCVEYTVELGGVCVSGQERALTPGLCSREELEAALVLLPRAKRVDLRRSGLSPIQARELSRRYPNITFLWEETVGEYTFSTDVEELDLSGAPMESTAQVEELLPYLPRLKKVIMCDCGLSSETMDNLGKRHPKIRFVWRVKLGPLSARTDDTWFAPITHSQLIGGTDADELKYCTDMECIDLGHCWISNCDWAANMKKLRYLVLADTYVRDLTPLSGLKNLVYLELFVTPVRDYSPLLGCTGLEDLNLGYTYGSPAPIARMTWLKNLWWGGIGYVPWVNGQSPAATLYAGLPDTKIMLYAGSSTGLGWRTLPHYYEMRDRIGMYYMTG